MRGYRTGPPKWVKDAAGEIVWHSRWPEDTWQRGTFTILQDLHEGISSYGLHEGDRLYVAGRLVWDESAARKDERYKPPEVFGIVPVG